MSRRVGRGFSILELLFVLAIIGILVALLLPALERTRDAARRTTCRDNLRQIGLALHNYHEVAGRLPPGAILDRYAPQFRLAGNDEAYSWTWTSQLLPYLGLEEYARTVGVGDMKVAQVMGNPERAALAGVRLEVWRCPSDIGPDVHPPHADDSRNFKNLFGAPLSNYPAAYGHRTFAAKGTPDKETGAFYCDSPTRLSDLTDGSSSTILVGERHWEVSGKRWWAANVLGIRVPEKIYGGTACYFNLRAKINEHSAADIPREQGLSSNHAGGVQILLGDGSVRFLNERVEFANTPEVDSVLERLVARADGQNVGEF